jgi:hypothetical protein
MRKLFCLISLLVLSASSHAVQGWMWFNNFPWVYSHEDDNWIFVATEIEVSLYDGGKWSKQDNSYVSNLGWVWMNHFPSCYSYKKNKWIYISPKNIYKIYVFRGWNKEWSELDSYKHDWNKQYDKWIQNPEPYGGLEVLQQIKEAKDSSITVLGLDNNNITDLTPLAGLTNLTYLYLNDNNISDLSPLAGLTNLEVLWLDNNNITDLTPLAGLTNLVVLYLPFNNITDVTPLAGLTNLTELSLRANNISNAQKSMLQYGALTNTNVLWYSSTY